MKIIFASFPHLLGPKIIFDRYVSRRKFAETRQKYIFKLLITRWAPQESLQTSRRNSLSPPKWSIDERQREKKTECEREMHDACLDKNLRNDDAHTHTHTYGTHERTHSHKLYTWLHLFRRKHKHLNHKSHLYWMRCYSQRCQVVAYLGFNQDKGSFVFI